MAVLLADTTIEVSPDRLMFGLADADAAEEPWPAPPISPAWVSCTGSALLVQTAQDGVVVAVRLQVWDGPPERRPDDEDAELTMTVMLDLPSGELSVNEITGGWRPGVLTLPRPGVWHARLSAHHRLETACAYEDLLARHTVTEPAFECGRRELEGVERYTFAFWLPGS